MEIIIKIKDEETINFYKKVDPEIIIDDFLNNPYGFIEDDNGEITINFEDD